MPNIPMINRRQLLLGLGAGSVGAFALRGYTVQAQADVYFTHGIASGDPLHDRVILWTRVIPGQGQHQDLHCDWELAQDAAFKQIISKGSGVAKQQHDYTVKVDATGLEAGQNYFYRFLVNGISSPVGQTKTLARGEVEHFAMGVASCSNFPQGYFNAYRHMAEAELDVVLHLGDYIYEYKEGVYANPVALEKLGRHVKPSHEITAIEDYRMRYGLYRTDEDLQAVHARHPFICVWDDHELSNNTWKAGAENHNEGEGDFFERMAAARQAYHEWLPIRTGNEGQQGPIFRSFPIGKLADLIMLDTRLHGRDRGLEYRHDLGFITGAFDISDAKHPVFLTLVAPNAPIKAGTEHVLMPFDHSNGNAEMVQDYDTIKGLTKSNLPKNWHYLADVEAFKAQLLDKPERTILGQDQEQWLTQALIGSKQRNATWQIIGQQVLMGRVGMPLIKPEQVELAPGQTKEPSFIQFMRKLQQYNLPLNLDAWDGYPACRDRVYDKLLAHANNPLVLAGDTHTGWAFNLRDNKQQAVGVEIATPGISSPGLESFMPTSPEVAKAALMKCSPELVEADTSQRGWTEIHLTPEKMTSRWHFVSTVLDKTFTTSQSPVLTAHAGDRKLQL